MAKKTKTQIKEDLSYIDDKTLKKVEKYVEKKREETSQEMTERKSRRPSAKYQEADLEVMISRISNESQPKNIKKKNRKWIIYTIYAIIMIAILISCIKFFMWNVSQISQIIR